MFVVLVMLIMFNIYTRRKEKPDTIAHEFE